METNTDPLTQLKAELVAAEDLNVILAERCKRLDALVWSIGWPTLACCPADLQQARNLAYSAHQSALHASRMIENVIELLEDTYPGESA